jgi:hypothetical protein
MIMAKKSAKRAGNHRPKKWRPPKPELFDWSQFDPSMAQGTHADSLARDLVAYRDNLKELLRDKGRYVLIVEGKIIGVYTERDQAWSEVVTRFGDKPVLIKQIVAKEPMISMGGVIS